MALRYTCKMIYLSPQITIKGENITSKDYIWKVDKNHLCELRNIDHSTICSEIPQNLKFSLRSKGKIINIFIKLMILHFHQMFCLPAHVEIVCSYQNVSVIWDCLRLLFVCLIFYLIVSYISFVNISIWNRANEKLCDCILPKNLYIAHVK